MTIAKGLLLDDAGLAYDYVETPNYYRNTDGTPLVMTPSLLVWHYTGGSNSLPWLTSEASQAGAHLLISRCGLVIQMAPFDRCVWHAGRASSWKGRANCNLFSIGIELENLGDLEARDGAWYGPARWDAKRQVRVPNDQVLVASHKNGWPGRVGWHRYTPQQMAVAARIGAVLRDLEQAGHEDVLPAVKSDPGPAFQWTAVR